MTHSTIPPSPPHVYCCALRQVKTKPKQYQAHLLPLMEHSHRKAFKLDHKWIKVKLKVDPQKDHELFETQDPQQYQREPRRRPTQANTIKSWKKAWSFFRLNKMTNWDKISKRNNPTHCVEINHLIGSMIKMEVARRGMQSIACRALTNNKYQLSMGQLGVGDTLLILSTWLPAYFAFQVSMIVRVDDTTNFRGQELRSYMPFPEYAITAML